MFLPRARFRSFGLPTAPTHLGTAVPIAKLHGGRLEAKETGSQLRVNLRDFLILASFRRVFKCAMAWDHACGHMSLLSWALLSSVSDVACLCCWMLRLQLLQMVRFDI